MATSCEDVSARMMEILYGELPADERASIQAHIETERGGCDRCRAELAELQKTRAVARRVLDETPPPRAHAAILRAAAQAVAARSSAPEKRADPARASFWDRLRTRWTLPTLATVGAVAIFLLASKIFLEPEKTYERGRQGLRPVPVEAPTSAPTTAGAPATAPAEEAQRSAPGAAALRVAAPKMAAPADDAPAERKAAVRAHAGPGATSGPSALGSGAAQSANKPRALPERVAKEKSEAAREEYAEPPGAWRADRAFAQPPPRSASPAPVAAADDGDGLFDRQRSERPRQNEGLGSGGGASQSRLAEKKSSTPARSTAKGFAGLGNHIVEGGARAPAAQASPDTLAKAVPPRERTAGASRAESAPAPAPAAPPPTSAPMAAKRDRAEAASEEAMADGEAAVARNEKEADKSARKPPETPVAHADRLFSEGRWAEAAAAYRDLIRRDPRNVDAGRWRQRLAAAEAALAPGASAPPPR